MLYIGLYKIFMSLLFAPLALSKSEDDGDFEVGEQIPGVSHLCIFQHWFRDELIVCDIKQTNSFACVGAIEGEIKLCANSTQNEIFAPVCLQDYTAKIITCKYKNLASGNLCLPRKSLPIIRNDPFRKYNPTPRIAFRVCQNSRRFACFNEGDINLCDELKVDETNYSETQTDENDCKSPTSENCKGPNYPDRPTNSANGYNNQNVEVPSKLQRKSSDIENQNRTLHHLLLDFHETYRASLVKGNSQQHLEKTNHEISQEGSSRKTSSDKNKSDHKTSKRRRHKKIGHNYDKGERDKNTTDSKYHNAQYNNVSSAIKHSETEKLETGGSKFEDVNKYFHIIKCEDCEIDHVIKVEKDAYNVKMWRLPTI